MKAKVFLFTLILLLTGITITKGQGFTPPAPGKAVVYFVRVSSYGGVVSFEFFHQDKYIGIFKGRNYMRYECDPGQNLFWASSENKEFITADLKEGGTYLVVVNIEMGAWKARVGLAPVTIQETELFERAKELILEKAPVVTPEDKIQSMNVKLADFIPEKLDQYETEWKSTKFFEHISADMAIPAEYMK
ncbi:MAG: hypothetical protein HOO86_02910 [Bacteroidales bacterium]|nr:hypothetical protein [Bacteroidales bacterium]